MILVQWSDMNLSYKGGAQLVQWIFFGKLNYMFQSLVTPKSVLDKIKSITYRFIWGGQKEIT